MKRLITAIVVAIAALVMSFGACAQDFYPDGKGAYTVNYTGKAYGQYILLVLKGDYQAAQLESALTSYTDKDVLYYGFESADETGVVTFEEFFPREYCDGTVILGGTSLEKPVVLGKFLSDGASDLQKLEIRGLQQSYVVSGALGQDVVCDFTAFMYDSYGNASLQQPEITLGLKTQNPADVFFDIDGRLYISAFAAPETVEVYAKSGEFSNSVYVDIVRSQSVPSVIEVFCDADKTVPARDHEIYGVNGVFPQIQFYCDVYDNFLQRVEVPLSYKVDSQEFSGVFAPLSVGKYSITVSTESDQSVYTSFDINVFERPDYTDNALALYEKISEAKSLLHAIGTYVYVSQEQGEDVYPEDKWVTKADVQALEAALQTATQELSDFDGGLLKDSELSAKVIAINRAINIYNSKVKDGKRVDAMSISLLETQVVMMAGDVHYLEAVLLPGDNTETITWESSNANVVTVNEKGRLNAYNKGSSIITVKTRSGLRAYCEVFVYAPASRITLSDPSVLMILDGDDYRVDYSTYPEGNNDVLTWSSSDENVATVDKNGVIHAVGPGSATIKVTGLMGKSAGCYVTVGLNADMVEFVTVPSMIEVDESTAIKAVACREDGLKVVDSSVTYSIIDGAVHAELLPDGKIKGLSPGVVTVKASANSSFNLAYETVTIKVGINAQKVKFEQSKYSMVVGQEPLKLNAVMLPEDNTDELTWSSSDESIAVVDSDGVVTALSKGRVTIKATSLSKKSDSCSITIGLSADAVEFSSLKATSIAVGKSVVLRAKAFRNDGQKPVSTNVVYEIVSGSEFGRIDAKGRFEALNTGSVVIRATAESSLNNAFDDIQIDVVIPITSLRLEVKKASLVVGGADLQLGAFLSSMPIEHTDNVSWSSSNRNVAVVDDDGNVTAVGAGSAKITAKSGSGKSIYCTVSVGLAADKVEFSPLKSNVVAVGKSLSLKASASRQDGQKPVSSGVVYRIISGNECGEIDERGRFKATSTGQVVIRATAEASLNGEYQDITINVVIPITSLKLEVKKADMVVGGDELYLGQGLVEVPFDNTDIVLWTSSDEQVAVVDENGVVKAVGAGKAKITVKSGSGKSTYCTVNVGLAADAVEFVTQDQVSVSTGKTLTLKATAFRYDGQKPINTAVTYEIISGSEYGELDSRGRFKATGIGQATIRATAIAAIGQVYADITVNAVPTMYGVILEQSSVVLSEGQTFNVKELISAYTRESIEIDIDKYCELILKPSVLSKVEALDDRYILAVSQGKATVKITVKCASVSKTVTLNVTVVEAVEQQAVLEQQQPIEEQVQDMEQEVVSEEKQADVKPEQIPTEEKAGEEVWHEQTVTEQHEQPVSDETEFLPDCFDLTQTHESITSTEDITNE